VLFNAVVVGGGNVSVCALEWGGCTCKHSDAQVTRGHKWGLRDERDFTLGTAMSPLYKEVDVCRAVVRHTCAWRLQNRGKCNRRGEIRGNVGKRRYSLFELVSIAPSTPLAEKRCVASKMSNVVFKLKLLLGFSNWALGL